ncbi:hypothetical protein [Teredinibacter sp. KSP-S5-2]|uniref:hypothetical protein n=1 Tax=Teredinibacter sp. KSP-S5-2 TaxID=3034506 RepID=UPI002934A238|nr:hypothetical protein [Teredinibacter sp. KSP-S5-2]WNO09392.1 hypothetical protein P5V12_20840 [Teredinibacter sp. KSP-S5-2]
MKKKVALSPEDIAAVKSIALREGFCEVVELLDETRDFVEINSRQAQLLMNVMVFEGHRHLLKYPFDQPEHPKHDPGHADKQQEFFHGLYFRFTTAIEFLFEINRQGARV